MKTYFILIVACFLSITACNKNSPSPEQLGPYLLFYSFSDKEGNDIFESSEFNINDLRVEYQGVDIPSNVNQSSLFRYVDDKDGLKVFQLEQWYRAEAVYLDFGNADIDTLKFDSSPKVNDIFTEMIGNRLQTVSIFYNGNLIRKYDVSRPGTEDREILANHLSFTERAKKPLPNSSQYPEVFVIIKE